MPSTKVETRDLIAEAYGETLSEEFTQGIGAYTIENLMQEELDRLEGPVAGKYRHAAIPYLEDLWERFEASIEAIKKIPPEQFELSDTLDNSEDEG